MGLDFIRIIAPSFERSLDAHRVMLRTPQLFGRDLPLMARTASADICHGATMTIGERVLLRILNGGLVAQRDNLVIAQFSDPPAEYLNLIETGAGVAQGEVKSIRRISQTVEIGICP